MNPFSSPTPPGYVAVTAGLLTLGPGCRPHTGATGDSGDCGVVLEESTPYADQSDFPSDASLEFRLSGPDPQMEPTVRLIDSQGTDIAGETTWSQDRQFIFFEPSGPLDDYTDYTATLSFCGGSETIPFRTDLYERTADLEGRTWVVDLESLTLAEGNGFDDLLDRSHYAFSNLLVTVLGTTNSNIEMLAAPTAIDAWCLDEQGEADLASCLQHPCLPTTLFDEGNDFSADPIFEVGPADVHLDVEGYSFVLRSLTLSGIFARDGSSFWEAELSVVLDTRDLPVVGDDEEGTPPEEEYCELVESFGNPCEACDSDGEPYCVDIRSDPFEAPEVEAMALEELAEDDIDEDCGAR